MKRPVASSSLPVVRCRNVARTRRVRGRHTACAAYNTGYTLIEILVATTLSLLLLGAVVAMFGNVGGAITESRSMLEVGRAAAAGRGPAAAGPGRRDRHDEPAPRPRQQRGLFRVHRRAGGDKPAMTCRCRRRQHRRDRQSVDTTVGDFDDILMFTTRSTGRPFVGRFGGRQPIQSDVAEVAWFVRGRTLHRRVLLVAPAASTMRPRRQASTPTMTFRPARQSGEIVVPNTLGDLTRRECRFAHTVRDRSRTTVQLVLDGNGISQSSFPRCRRSTNVRSTDGFRTHRPRTLHRRISISGPTTPAIALLDNALRTGTDCPHRRRRDPDQRHRLRREGVGSDGTEWPGGSGAYADLGYNTATIGQWLVRN